MFISLGKRNLVFVCFLVISDYQTKSIGVRCKLLPQQQIRFTVMNSERKSIEVHNSSSVYFVATADSSTSVPISYSTGTLLLPATDPAFWTPVNITCVIIGVTGISGNLFSCIVIARYPPLRKRLTNYFIVNQCFLDLATALVLMLNITLEYKLRRETGPSLYAACYLIYSRVIFTSVFAASIWNLSALAVERYLKIVHAIRHKTSVTKTKIVVTCVAVWVFAFLYRSVATLPLVSVIGGVCRVPVFKSASGKMVFGLAIFLGDFFLPMCTIAFCYVHLTRKLRRSQRDINSFKFDDVRNQT
jgi:hypothetical protein